MNEKKIKESVVQRHNEILYPTVRVVSEKGTGSGTVIYSKKNVKGLAETYVITNHHVVESAITVKKIWDARVGKDVKRDVRSTVTVEFFKYNNFSHCVGSFGVEADIVGYDAEQDMALLKLRDEERVADNVANFYPLDKIKEIHIFDEVYACGAALGHAPLQTKGEITYMDDEIENFKYWMSSAQIIYGNSGGSVYRLSSEGTYQFIGIPSRVQVSLSGFSANPITHMGYFIPIDRACKFLEVNSYQFIYDDKFTSEQCTEERKRMKDMEIAKLERQLGIIEEEGTK